MKEATERTVSDLLTPLATETLAFAHGGPLGAGIIRTLPEDFIVRESLGFEASGDGEHVLLKVRKRAANTKWVAKQIAQHAGIRVREVGFAGLKDRHALTEQYFTVRSSRPPEEWRLFSGEGFAVIDAARQRRKLRLGAHRGNEFEITVRDCRLDANSLAQRLHVIESSGVPNYFGEQRFGHFDGNLRTAERWLCEGVSPSDRDARSFALSAARSALFNAVLAERVRVGTWNRLLPGEVVNLDGTGSIFVPEVLDVALEERCTRLDIHPTGPLCGKGEPRESGEVLRIEDKVLEPWRDWRRGLERINVERQRRALRLAVSDLKWEYAADTLRLQFRLMRGAFATAVLREIITTTTHAERAP